jgi:signal transduction histidine kinase
MKKIHDDSRNSVSSIPAASPGIRPEPERMGRSHPLNICGIVFLWLFSFISASWSQTTPVDSTELTASPPERPKPQRADSAYILLSDSLAAARAAGDRSLEARHLKDLGRLLWTRKKYTEAEQMLMRGRRIAEPIKDRADLKDIYASLSEILAAQEDYPGALRYLRLYSATKESLAAEALQRRTVELETRYRSDANQRETLLGNRINDLERSADSLRKTTITAILIGGLLSVCLSMALLRGLRRGKRLTRELKDANERLVELERFKQGMTGMMAQDFANPLNGILVHSVGANDRPRRAVRQAAGRMLNQVFDVLDVDRFENAEMKLKVENVLLRVPAEQAEEEVRFLAEEKNVAIHNDIVRTSAALMDPGIVRRVLTNLLINAVKFSNPGGEVWMKAIAGDGGFIRVSVNDTGEGLSPEQRERIFEKFGLIESRHSGRVRSTGLGLVFCKYAVEAHGGTLVVQSEPGIGTSFEFTLPKAGSPLNGGSAMAASSGPNSGLRKRVALSDSDRKKLKPILKKLGSFGIEDLDKIRECLKRIDDRDPELKRWKEAVEAAAFECDEGRFRELVKT